MNYMNCIVSAVLIAPAIFAQGANTGSLGGSPRIGIPDFANLTAGNLERVAPGKYREENVKVGSDERSESSRSEGKNVQTRSSRDVYEKQLERNIEIAPGEWKLPESSSKIAADAVAGALKHSGRFTVLSRGKFSIAAMDEERKMTFLRNGTEEYMKLCRDLNAKYLVTGGISGFRIDMVEGNAYGVEMKRVTTRVTLDLRALDVATGEIAYQGAPSQTVNLPIPAGVTTTEIYDWEKALRGAIDLAAEDLILGLAKGTGASVAGLETVNVMVESTPSGADVLVDGLFVGNTPAEVELEKGRRTIKIERQGYQSWERPVKAFDGMKIRPTLEPVPDPPSIKPRE